MAGQHSLKLNFKEHSLRSNEFEPGIITTQAINCLYFLIFTIKLIMTTITTRLLQTIKMPAACIFIILMLSTSIYFILDLPYKNLSLPFSNNSYFWFDGRQLTLVSTIPFLCYMDFYSFVALFSKNHQPSKSIQRHTPIIAISSLIILTLMTILSILFYFYIIIFTDYKPCHETDLEYYYVTDYKLCEKLQ